MAALRSYAALSKQVQLILNRAKKSGLKLAAIDRLNSNLEVFWAKRGKKKPTKSGISFNKKMSAADRKEMAQILRAFIKEPRTEKKSIEDEYKEKMQSYLDNLSPKNRSVIEQKIENKTTQEMYDELERIDKILKDRRVIESLGSKIVNEIYRYEEFNNMNTDIMERALWNVTDPEREVDFESMDPEEIWDMVIKEYDSLMDEEDEEL